MHIVIIAAGIQEKSEAHNVPKVLLPLGNGRTILGQLVTNLNEYTALDHLKIVFEEGEEEIRAHFPNFRLIEKSVGGTAKSLLAALDDVDGALLFMKGNVVFQSHVLRRLIHYGGTTVVVNQDKVDKEEVKVATDGAGKILEISRNVSKEIAEGEALGMVLISEEHIDDFKKALQECGRRDGFEKALEELIEMGIDVNALTIDETECIEIDSPDDITRVNQIFFKS